MTEVTTYSAAPRDYLAATPENRLYGGSGGLPERRLFPGLLPTLLALIALLAAKPRRWSIAYVIGFIVAFELSLGTHGFSYPFLYEYVPAFQALRVPARASIICLLFLGVLASYGCAVLLRHAGRVRAFAVAAVLVLIALVEYWAPPRLGEFPNAPPPVYTWLARQPGGVVLELPVPGLASLPGRDPVYAYMSTFHWQPLLNGYSGYYPADYLQRLDRLAEFPAGRTIDQLRGINVRYVIVHADGYSSAEFQRIAHALTEAGSVFLASFLDGPDPVTVFRLQ